MANKILKPIGKKGQTGGDYFAFFLALFVTLGMITLTLVIISLMKYSAEDKIEVRMEKLQDNAFLIHYLAYPVGSQNMASLISASYINNDYSELEKETTALLYSLYGKEKGWEIFIDDKKVAESCSATVSCRGRSKSFESIIPLHSKGIVKIKIKVT